MLPQNVMTKLTPRERQVLVKVAVGKTNAQIAHDLGISEHTVKDHMGRLLDQFKCNNRVQLVVTAIFGAIPLEETMGMFVNSNWGSGHDSRPV